MKSVPKPMYTHPIKNILLMGMLLFQSTGCQLHFQPLHWPQSICPVRVSLEPFNFSMKRKLIAITQICQKGHTQKPYHLHISLHQSQQKNSQLYLNQPKNSQLYLNQPTPMTLSLTMRITLDHPSKTSFWHPTPFTVSRSIWLEHGRPMQNSPVIQKTLSQLQDDLINQLQLSLHAYLSTHTEQHA